MNAAEVILVLVNRLIDEINKNNNNCNDSNANIEQKKTDNA